MPFIHNSDTPLYFTGMSNKGNMFKGAIPKKSSWLSFQTLNKTQCAFMDGEQLRKVLSDEYFNAVMAVWGDNPTVDDPMIEESEET